jgi:hypothetical protein
MDKGPSTHRPGLHQEHLSGPHQPPQVEISSSTTLRGDQHPTTNRDRMCNSPSQGLSTAEKTINTRSREVLLPETKSLLWMGQGKKI